MAFSDNVWKTRKSRINTSERFKKNDLISQILIAYYSFFIIAITIVDIKCENINFEILTLILSILIVIVSIFIFAMNYKERALILQTSYVLMAKLYDDILEKENKNEDYSDLKNQYNMIISLTENHSDNDYLQVMYEVRNQKKYEEVNGKWTYEKGTKRLMYKIKHFITLLFLFILPIIILVISIAFQ